MNYEESRLRTFNNWPTDAPIDAARVANGGFFYTGQGMEVQCFSCGGKISEWSQGDHVMARHRRLDPRCPFIVNPAMSGNVPKAIQSTQTFSSHGTDNDRWSTHQSDRYLTKEDRLRSYIDWPVSHIVTPDSLAEAGFYSVRQADKVKCAYCNGVVGFWEAGDDPKSEHRRHFPNCPFIISNFGQTVMPTATTSTVKTVPDLQELGIQTHKGPRQSDYATLESRLRTFKNWPVELIQTPDMLAEAGFYYVGMGDQVRCFHCDGGLRHWDPTDDPWVEHARWFPTCAYLRIVRGSEFIKNCEPEFDVDTVEKNKEQRTKHSMPSGLYEVTETQIQSYMNTPEVLTALNIGIDIGRVKNAIRYKLQMTGCGFSCADTLIECALNLELDEPESSGDSEVSEEVSRILSNVLIQTEQETRSDSKPETIPKKSEDKVVSKSSSFSMEGGNLSLEEENRLLREARLCKICMDNEIGIVFLPCGHLTTCVNCAPSLKDCPVCRSIIKATVRTFLS